MPAIVMVETSENLEARAYASDAFVPLAVEAGILTVINSLTPLALSEGELLLQLKTALAESNPPLAAALTVDTLAAIMEYANVVGNPVIPVENLPEYITATPPVLTSAGRDGGAPSQVNIGFTAPPPNYTYRIYLDGVFAKAGNLPPSGGTVFEALFGVSSSAHTVRVLFVSGGGAYTMFSNIQNIPAI